MTTSSHDTQLLKGVLPTLVLAALAAEESYGYELVTRLQGAGLGSLTTGTVYPVLGRLERDGLLEAHLVPSASGPARKYYRPTPAGRSRLTDGVAGWTALDAVVRTLARGASSPSSAARTPTERTPTNAPRGPGERTPSSAPRNPEPGRTPSSAPRTTTTMTPTPMSGEDR